MSFCFLNSSFAQEKLSVRIEGSYTNDIYSRFDPNQSLISVPLSSGSWSIILRKEMTTSRFLFESGISGKYYWEGIRFSQVPIWFSYLNFHAILIPVRVGYKINFVKGFQLVPSVSLISAVITDPLDPGGASGSISSITFNYQQKELADPFFFMYELRLALEKKIRNSFRISLFYSRTFGFETVNEMNVEYAINGTPYEGRYTSKGDYWSVGVGIAYLLKPKIKAE